jgi:hypothetical protein
VARKEEVGRRFVVWFTGGALEAIVAALELLQLGEARWFSGSSPTLLSIGGMAFQTLKATRLLCLIADFPLVVAKMNGEFRRADVDIIIFPARRNSERGMGEI